MDSSSPWAPTAVVEYCSSKARNTACQRLSACRSPQKYLNRFGEVVVAGYVHVGQVGNEGAFGVGGADRVEDTA